MHTTLTLRHLEKNKEIESFFNERAGKLMSRLSNFNGDSIFLHATLDKNPHKEQFFVQLTVYLPSMVMHSREEALDLFGAINSAFEAITRQVEKFKQKLRIRNRKKQNI